MIKDLLKLIAAFAAVIAGGGAVISVIGGLYTVLKAPIIAQLDYFGARQADGYVVATMVCVSIMFASMIFLWILNKTDDPDNYYD